MPHVMFGGLVHEQALTLARRLAGAAGAHRSRPRVFQRIRLGRGRSRDEDGGAVLAQPRRVASARALSPSAAAITATPPARWRCPIPRASMHAAFRGLLPQQIIVDLPVDEASTTAFETVLARARRRDRRASSSSRWCKARAACAFTTPQVLRTMRAAADRYDILLIFDEIFTGFGRTGALFAFQAAGVVPDIITLSQGADRRHAAACRDDRAQKGVRGVLVGRSCARADARADFHGQRARLRGRQCLARSVRNASRGSIRWRKSRAR